MAARLHVVDAGGVSRLIKRLFVVDAGGVTRLVQRLLAVDAGAVTRLVYLGTVIDLVNRLISATSISPANAEAAYRLTNAGEQQRGLNGSYTTQSAWIVPSGTEGDYDVEVNVLSGALTSGTTGTRLALNVTRTWTLERTTIGAVACQFTATIRRTADSVVMDVATIDLEAEEA